MPATGLLRTAPRGAGRAGAVVAALLIAVTTLSSRAIADDGERCLRTAAAIEEVAGIPQGLLQAISRAETGRGTLKSGGGAPWPWTINAGGKGYHFASRADAIAAVRRYQARGQRSIDVGCFQVNLRYHPEAFPTLQEAFDPLANGAYAAWYLLSLKERWGSWREAVARYHSSTPARQSAYMKRVGLIWRANAATAPPEPPSALAVAAEPRLLPPPKTAPGKAPLGLRSTLHEAKSALQTRPEFIETLIAVR